jgi:hypothetical protein
MSNKRYLFIFAISSIIGLCLVTKEGVDIHKDEKRGVIKQQVNIDTGVTNARYSQDKDSSYVEKFYNKKGVLIHEIEKKQENRASDVNFTKHTDQSEVVSSVTSATSSSIEVAPMSSWLVGFSLPVTLHPDFQTVNAQIGYRLLGPVYITGQTDYKFSKPTVGFLVNF